jgi:hypothetical protein
MRARLWGRVRLCWRSPVGLLRSTVLLLRSTVLLLRSTVLLLRSTVLLLRSTVLLLRSTVLLLRSTVLLLRCCARWLGCARIPGGAARWKTARWVAVALTAAKSAGLHPFRVSSSPTEQHHEIRSAKILGIFTDTPRDLGSGASAPTAALRGS